MSLQFFRGFLSQKSCNTLKSFAVTLALLLAQAFLTNIATAAESGSAEQLLIFSMDATNHPTIMVTEPNSRRLVQGVDPDLDSRQMGRQGEQERFEQFRLALLGLLANGYRAACNMHFLPTGFTLNAEVVSVSWEQKQLCSKTAKDLLDSVMNADETSRASFRPFRPVFRLPKSQARVANFQEESPYRKLTVSEDLNVQQEFLNNVAKFFCEFPLRPSEIEVKFLSSKFEWKMNEVCKNIL